MTLGVTRERDGAVERFFATALVIVLSSGCTILVPGAPVSLVDMNAWTLATGDADPFSGEGGPDVVCSEEDAGFYLFGGEPSLEIRTDFCARATMTQPAAVAIGTGDIVAVRGWHEQLTAPEPAEAVVALAIDGAEIWRAVFPIPSDGGPILAEITAPRDFGAGVPIAWHVHNHGKNAYNLLDLVVRPLVPESEAP